MFKKILNSPHIYKKKKIKEKNMFSLLNNIISQKTGNFALETK